MAFFPCAFLELTSSGITTGSVNEMRMDKIEAAEGYTGNSTDIKLIDDSAHGATSFPSRHFERTNEIIRPS